MRTGCNTCHLSAPRYLLLAYRLSHTLTCARRESCAAARRSTAFPLVYSGVQTRRIFCTMKVGVVHVEESKSLLSAVLPGLCFRPRYVRDFARPACRRLRQVPPAAPGAPAWRRVLAGLLLALDARAHSCAVDYYRFPQYTYAGRPIPPSKLAQRVMISVTVNGSIGSLQIVDALRDIRSNVENTIPSFSASAATRSGYPIDILNFPAETHGLRLLGLGRKPGEHQLLHRKLRGALQELFNRAGRGCRAPGVHAFLRRGRECRDSGDCRPH